MKTGHQKATSTKSDFLELEVVMEGQRILSYSKKTTTTKKTRRTIGVYTMYC